VLLPFVLDDKYTNSDHGYRPDKSEEEQIFLCGGLSKRLIFIS
jgi:hypothetical protein